MAKGPWRSAVDRALGRSDVKESGVGRGGYSDNHGGHEYTDIGLTERQIEVMNAYLEYGLRGGARHLGITKGGIVSVIQDVGDRLGTGTDSLPDAREAFISAIADTAYSVPDNTTENYTDQSVEGGDHPWLYDNEGNYIG